MPVNEDRGLLLDIVQAMVAEGAQIPIVQIAKQLQVPIARDGEAVLKAPAKALPTTTDNPAAAVNVAVNAQERRAQRSIDLLEARALDLFGGAISDDLKPLREAIANVMHGSDERTLMLHAETLYHALPELGNKIIAADGSVDALEKSLSAALASGIAEETQHEEAK